MNKEVKRQIIVTGDWLLMAVNKAVSRSNKRAGIESETCRSAGSEL